MQSADVLVKLFRQNGLKITPQGRVIFELLSQDESQPTVEDIYQRVLLVMPEVSRTTVYNTLHTLVALGELSPVEEMSEGEMRYDTNNFCHHYVFCMRCSALMYIH